MHKKIKPLHKDKNKKGSSTTIARGVGNGGMENLSVINSRYQRTEFTAGRTAGNLKKSRQQEN